MQEQNFIHILIDSRFGPIAASADLNAVTAKLVEVTTKEGRESTLVNPGSYRIKSVPLIDQAAVATSSTAPSAPSDQA